VAEPRRTAPVTPARSGAADGVVEAHAVIRGAIVAIAVCLPLALLSQQVIDADRTSPLAAPLFLLVLVGFAAGGFVAARAAGGAPFTNGGLAALAAFAVIQGAALVIRLAADDPPAIPVIVFNGLLAYACGLAGGAVAARRRRRPDGQA